MKKIIFGVSLQRQVHSIGDDATIGYIKQKQDGKDDMMFGGRWMICDDENTILILIILFQTNTIGWGGGTGANNLYQSINYL